MGAVNVDKGGAEAGEGGTWVRAWLMGVDED
jgi:hypothetical protein